jgi:hypothetical protein
MFQQKVTARTGMQEAVRTHSWGGQGMGPCDVIPKSCITASWLAKIQCQWKYIYIFFFIASTALNIYMACIKVKYFTTKDYTFSSF